MDWFSEIINNALNEITVVGMAMVPVVELRGAIPYGIIKGMAPWTAFWLAYIGSIIPCPLIILFIKPVMKLMRKIKFFRKMVDWYHERAETKGKKIRKYALLGIFLYVAIPLPGTGVWTGSTIASVLEVRMKHAVPVVALGNLVAGLIIFYITYLLG